MKKIFLLISLASALIAFPIRTECQSLPVGVNPPPLAAHMFTGSVWTPITSPAMGQALPAGVTPPRVGLYCYNSGLNQWVAATSACFVAANTVTGTGTSGTIPIWTGANTLGNSLLTYTTDNLKFTAPSAEITVQNTSSTTAGQIIFPDSSAVGSLNIGETGTSGGGPFGQIGGFVAQNDSGMPLAIGTITNDNILFYVGTGNTLAATVNGSSGATQGQWTLASVVMQSSRKGTFVCTAAGTISIANTNEIATSDVVISMKAQGGTITTPPAMKTVTAGTGFTVLCGATDTSTYNYDILN